MELPEHWGRWQRAKNTLIYFGILAGAGLARIMPLFLLRLVGQIGAAVGFVFAFSDRKRAVKQLRESMPELKHPVWTIFQLFLHFGRLGAEWVKIELLTTPGSRYLQFDPAVQQVVRDALAEGNGVLCVTPHLGNWELLAQAACRHGLPCTTIAKPIYDPRLTALVDRFRGRSGLVTLWRGDGALRDRLTEVLAVQKSLLGVLIDQDTKVAHTFVPFFGRLAATPIVPQRLAIEHNCAVLFCYAAREGPRYRMHFERVEKPATPELLTAKLTALTEQAIRRYPSQWVWLHRRWKTRPQSEAL
jgi:KDO2-lipid IV(A) lauroyltransferase